MAFARRNLSWKSPGFPQTPDDPVVGVCWEDADQFCAWLTKKERSEGALTAFQRYRLPTDREWSEAVGLLHEEGATPEERSGRSKGVYPWGGAMPPPEGAGNYAGEESRQGAPASWNVLSGYRDSFPRTAPVEATPANALGPPRPRWQRLGVVSGPFQPIHQLARFARWLMGDVTPRGNALVLSAWL